MIKANIVAQNYSSPKKGIFLKKQYLSKYHGKRGARL
jgi:hypothetical protein